jgi:ribonucleoside-diphosphate reductase alpha chain
MCLQMGVPLDVLVQKFSFFRFEPSGFTENQGIPYAHSIADYVCRWLGATFVKSGECESLCSVAATGEVRATEDVRVGVVLPR